MNASQSSSDTHSSEENTTAQTTVPTNQSDQTPEKTNASPEAGQDSISNAKTETVEPRLADNSNQAIQNGKEVNDEKTAKVVDSKDGKKDEVSTKSNPASNSKYLDEDGVNEILSQLDIDSPTISAEEKIKVLCTVFKTSITENVNYKEASRNIVDQLDKNEQTKAALQKLCKALKTQVDLKTEEGDLKLREESQKRIDCTTSFQNTITELSTLVEKYNMHNKNLQ